MSTNPLGRALASRDGDASPFGSALLREVPLASTPEIALLRDGLLGALERQLGRVVALAATLRDSERVDDDQKERALGRLEQTEQALGRLRCELSAQTTADGVLRLLARARRERVFWQPRTRPHHPFPAPRGLRGLPDG